LLGLSHETNTFSSVPADYAAFEREGILRGGEITDKFGESQATLAGFLEAGRELGFEAIPLLHARTGPIGLITKDAFDRIVGEMNDMLREEGPWDGVLLANHGAAVSEEFPDVDGEIAVRIRKVVGPETPVGMALDMHGNISQAVVKSTDIITIYRTNPHLDASQRAYECAELLLRAARGQIRPRQYLATPPLVINIVRQFTGEEPMKGLVADSLAVQSEPGILSTSLAEGYPYADVAEMGMSFLVVADGDLDLARRRCFWMARRAWRRRSEMDARIPDVDEALAIAASRVGENPSGGPVVLMDVGDNIGGGSSADSTHILRRAQQLGFRGLLQTLFDPMAVQACLSAGVGNQVELSVGGKTDDLHGTPVAVSARVAGISDGKYEDNGPTHAGYRFFDSGTTAVLETSDGHTLVLTSLRDGNTSREQMYAAGVRPERFRVVVAKGVVSPRPAYEPIASQILLVNTPGLTTADLSTFNYRYRRRPLFPFEPEARFEAD
jgi:microcystin degradation protein MlrC